MHRTKVKIVEDALDANNTIALAGALNSASPKPDRNDRDAAAAALATVCRRAFFGPSCWFRG